MYGVDPARIFPLEIMTFPGKERELMAIEGRDRGGKKDFASQVDMIDDLMENMNRKVNQSSSALSVQIFLFMAVHALTKHKHI